MPITPLPDPPSRQDPTNFSARTDAFLAALPAFATELNAMSPGESAAGLAQALASAVVGGGTSLVTHVASGSGPTPRTAADKLDEAVSVADYAGGDTTRFQRAVAVGAALVPPGSYTLTEQVDGVFWALDEEAVSEPTRNADIIALSRMETQNRSVPRARQLMRANAYLQNNALQGVVNLGDSISHGAYSGNAYTNHWTYLLARALAAEFGGESIGEYPMEGLHNPIPSLVTPQLADVVFSGWGTVGANPAPYDYPVGNIGAAAANAINGKTYDSSTNGASITLTLPTMGRAIAFRYTRQPGGGSFTISVNGAVKATVNTSGALAYNVSTSNVAVEDNGKGECIVAIAKTDANPVEINALYNLRTDVVAPTELVARMQLHNFAQSGRALKDMSEGVIIQACNSATLILSLGYNDWSLGSDSNDAIFAAFRQRIDWLIQYARVYRTLVVVQDFVWYADKHSRTRRQLKRLADAVRGIYIPYPDQFFSDDGQPTQSPLQLNDPMWLFADAAHPNAAGNELIFSTLASALGLTCNSRTLALRYHDWAYPLKISAGVALVNGAPTYPGSLTTIQQCGDTYQLKINLKPTGASIAQSTLLTACSALPEKFRGGAAISLVNMATPAAHDYGSGVAKTWAIVETPATLNVYTRVAGETECRCAASLPEIV